MAVAALVVAVLALLVAAASAWYARTTASATKRQASATEAQAEYARRTFERAELETAQARLVAQRASMLPPPVPWSVWSTGRNAFTLSNGSPRALYDVSLTFDVDPARVEPTEWERLDERASVRVMIVRAMGASPDTVTVHWRDEPGADVREWTTALQ